MEKLSSMNLVKILSLIWVFFSVEYCFGAITFIPAATIELTGSTNEVFFDVEDDIVTAGTSIVGPYITTGTRKFSGAFYLSGAGWVHLASPGYEVGLDCGLQLLSALSSPCDVTGTGYSEMIGDVIFESGVKYYPDLGYLSGTIRTYLGDYSFSHIYLPLRPAVFTEGTGSLAHHAIALSISGGGIAYGNGPWTIGFTPQSTFERRDFSPGPNILVDLSLASVYDVEIEDPQGSITQFHYTVSPNIPNFVLLPGTYFRNEFCTLYPSESRCSGGGPQKPSEIFGIATTKVANANDAYSITLNFRDQYGNEVREGDVSLDYRDTIRTFQVNPMEYMNFSDYCARNIDNYCALITGGALLSNDDGSPEIIHAPVLGGVFYTIASRAPTSAVDSLTLSGISYRDTEGREHDIFHPSLSLALPFTPWYTSSLSAGPITVGEETLFTPTLINTTPSYLPDSFLGLYHINIGSNAFASYTGYVGENIICTKDVGSAGTDVCDWVTSPDTSIISLWGSTFSGVYTPYSGHPSSENVSYRSYVRYIVGGTSVIYPSIAASFGMANAGQEFLKILGQENTPYTGIGVDNTITTNEWNSIKKNISLKSRGRTPTTGYDDVDYIIHTGSVVVVDSDLHGMNPKRAIAVLGGDITISGALQNGEVPTVLMALMDETGSGGNIYINPDVRELYTSLFAEKSIHSSGDNQLYIFGNIFSRNTLSTTKCPYYVTGVCNPELYNLEQMRVDYLDLPVKTGHTSNAPRAAEYPNTPLIIEYDGRLIQNPPALLTK